MANGIYKITEDFKKALSDYTGDSYVICLDNQSNGLLLSLYYEHHVSKTLTNDTITIPPRTYESVPCQDVSKKNNTNMELTYPNLSVFPIYKK